MPPSPPPPPPQGFFEGIQKALGDLGTLLGELTNSARNATGPLGDFQKALGGLGSALGAELLKSVQNVKGTFTDLIGTVAGSGSVLTKFSESIQLVGKSALSLSQSAVTAASAILAFGQQMAQFVKLANPVVFDQFLLVVNDLMAVVGRALVPIFQTLVIPVIRLFADVLNNLTPIGNAIATAFRPVVAILGVAFEIMGRALTKIGEIATQLAPSIAALGEVLLQLAKSVEPLYDLFIDVVGGALVEVAKVLTEIVKEIVPYLLAFARVLSDVVTALANGVRELLAMLGIVVSNTSGVKPGSSVGAATRTASITSVDDVVKQAQRNAFSLGTASKGDPASATAGYTKAIQDQTQKIYEFLTDLPNKMWQAFQQLPDLIATAISNLANKASSFITGQSDIGVGEATREAGKQFFDDIKRDVQNFGNRVSDQFDKPGVFGYTSINPF